LEPTEIALRFVSDIQSPIDQLGRYLAAAQRGDENDKILIAADFAFASFWLVPRIAGMQRDLGVSDIQVLSSQTPWSSSAQADLTIYLSDPDYVSVRSTALFRENVCAVAAPGYVEAQGSLNDLDDLGRHRFIHLTSPTEPMHWFDWGTWLEAATGAPAQKPPGVEVNS
jgi:DNA-binding transcriptional LysR family regulator